MNNLHKSFYIIKFLQILTLFCTVEHCSQKEIYLHQKNEYDLIHYIRHYICISISREIKLIKSPKIVKKNSYVVYLHFATNFFF